MSTLLPHTHSTIGSWARFIAQGLESCGVDSRQLFLDAGIDLDQSAGANDRLPVENMTQVWKLATERTGDPCFALTLAAKANPTMYSALGLSMISSRTVGEALSRGCRFSQIASDAATVFARECDNGNVEMVYRVDTGDAAPLADEALEAFIATSTYILRSVSTQGYHPLSVHFCHNKEAHRQRYEDFFNAPLIFDAPEYKTVIARETLDHPCIQANPELAEAMDKWMEDYLGSFGSDSLSARVCRLMAEKLPDGEVKQIDLARELAMSTRSLQRGLQNENNTFKELLDQTRQDLAIKYIGEKGLTLIEICCMLGFSDQSNFTKAFKRWTGQTPNAYRQEFFA